MINKKRTKNALTWQHLWLHPLESCEKTRINFGIFCSNNCCCCCCSCTYICRMVLQLQLPGLGLVRVACLFPPRCLLEKSIRTNNKRHRLCCAFAAVTAVVCGCCKCTICPVTLRTFDEPAWPALRKGVNFSTQLPIQRMGPPPPWIALFSS